MGKDDARVPCLWCRTDLNPKATICHGCGAIWARPPVSLFRVFFLHPSVAFALMLAGLGFAGLPVVQAGAVFVVSWLVPSLAHLFLGRRRRWIQVAPLLLDNEDTEAARVIARQPAGWGSWWATGATVAVGLALIWMGVPKSAATTAAPGPTPVALIAGAPSSSAFIMPLAQTASVVPADATSPQPKPTKQDAVKVEPAGIEPGKSGSTAAKAAKAEPVKIDTAKAETTRPEATSAPDKALILSAQRLLDDLGYAPGKVDGAAGSTTRAALRAFREHEKLGGRGIDADLVAALQSALKTKQELEARAENTASQPTKVADIPPQQQAEAVPAAAMASAAPETPSAMPATSGEDKASVRLGPPVRLR